MSSSAQSTAATVTGTRSPAGGSTIASSGSSAPTVKARKLAQAACQGLTICSGSMPSSTRACAVSASRAVSCSATSLATSGVSPRSSNSPVSSASSSSGCSASSRCSTASAARSESRWALTETYSPEAIESEPASSPASPAVSRVSADEVAPATPTTRPAVDTIPSLAPSTPARSQFSLLLRLPPGRSPGCSLSSIAPVLPQPPP